MHVSSVVIEANDTLLRKQISSGVSWLVQDVLPFTELRVWSHNQGAHTPSRVEMIEGGEVATIQQQWLFSTFGKSAHKRKSKSERLKSKAVHFH